MSAKNTRNCLNAFEKRNELIPPEDRVKLPNFVTEELQANHLPESIAALEKHISSLEGLKVQQDQKFDKEIKRRKISASTPSNYVNRSEDPGNELNEFNTAGWRRIQKNIIQRVGSMTKALHSKLINEVSLKDEERSLLEYFNIGFNGDISKAIDEVWKTKNDPNYRFEDMVQYLPKLGNESGLDEAAKTAIAATAFEWLHTNGRLALGQTNASMHTLLGIDKDDPIPKQTHTLLKDVGVKADVIAKQLGTTIAQRIGIRASEDADSGAQARLELSLGFMAMAALEQSGKFSRQEVYVGGVREDGSQFGMQALQADEGELSRADVFYEPTTEDRADKDRKKEGSTMVFMKLDNEGATSDFVDTSGKDDYPTTPDHMTRGEELMHAAPEAFDKVFNSEPKVWNFTWKKGKHKVKSAIGRDGLATSTQTANLQKSVDTPHTRNKETMDIFMALSPEAQQAVSGWVEETGKLNLRKDSIVGTNRGIQRDLESLQEWVRQAELQPNGLDSEFFIGAEFMNNMRMLMTGDVNTQNSKIMRNLFSPKSWVAEFKTTPVSQPKKTGLELAFLEAIAVSFGIESGKVGGSDNQIKELREKLNNSDVRSAIDAIKEHRRNPEVGMTPELEARIAAGVKETGEKVHGLKGLIEYARYEMHRGNSSQTKGGFSTDMYTEIDGVSNGVIISIMQLIPDSADKQAMLASLAMGGMSVHPTEQPNLDEMLAPGGTLYDAYKRMGKEWALNVSRMKEALSNDIDNPKKPFAEDNYNKALALEQILGRFTSDDGVLDKIIRNLSKPRTMQTSYGASTGRQSELFALVDVVGDGIYGKVENIIDRITNPKEDDSTDKIQLDLQTLFNSVATLTDKKPADINSYMTDGSLDIDKFKTFELGFGDDKSIAKAVRFTYGQAMIDAINEVYSPIIEARKPFNTLIQSKVTIYNMVLEKRVNAQIKINDAALEENAKAEYEQTGNKEVFGLNRAKKGRVTQKEMNKILDDIKHLIPRIRSPFHTESDPGYLALAEVGGKKVDGWVEKDYENPAVRVKQQYGGTIPQHTGYVDSIPYLKDVGASAMVRVIHMIDSSVANHLMGLHGIDIMNAHDGFPHSIKYSNAVRDAANTKFEEVMRTYNLGEEIITMHTEMVVQADEAVADAGLTITEIVDQLVTDGVLTAEIVGKYAGINPSEVRDTIKGIQLTRKGMTYREAADQFIQNIIPEQSYDKKVFLQAVRKIITEQAQEMAYQVTSNKREVSNNITAVAQYPRNGVGKKIKPLAPTEVMFADESTDTGHINPSNIETTDRRQAEIAQRETARGIERGFLASSTADVSTDVTDYQGSRKIDQQNVTETFEGIAAFDEYSPESSIQMSDSHKEHLTGVLNNIVKKVMAPVEMFMSQHNTAEEARGRYTIDTDNGNKIWVQTRKKSDHPTPGMLGQGVRMSAAEVYVHELVHHITHSGLKSNAHLKKDAYTLYHLAEKELSDRYNGEGYRVFMDNPYDDPANDGPIMADERIAAQARWDYIFNPERNADGSPSTKHVDEFITFGMTNENFKRELSTIDAPSKKGNPIFEKNLQTTLMNIFGRIMDFINEKFNNQRKATKVDQALENLVLAVTTVDNRGKTGLVNEAFEKEESLTARSVKFDESVKNWTNKKLSTTALGRRLSKQVVDAKGTIHRLPEFDTMISHQLRLLIHWYNNKEANFFQSVTTEMEGRTDRLQPFHTMLSKRKRVLDTAKNDVVKSVRDAANTWFDRELNSDEKVAITKGLLKTDMSSMLGKSSLLDISRYVTDSTAREDRIQELLSQIAEDPELKRHAVWFENASDDLGYYMITSKGRKVGEAMMNAHNIALMKGTPGANSLTGDAFDRGVSLAEQLATLSSLRYIENAQRITVGSLMRENIGAIEDVFNMHLKLKNEAIKSTFNGQPTLMQKGYIRQILNARIKYEQGTLADKERFEDAGYIMQTTPIRRDPNDPVQENIYMFKSVTGTVNDLQPGIVSYTRNSQKGTTPYDLQLQVGSANPSSQAQRNNRKVLSDTDKRLDDMYKKVRSGRIKPDTSNYMVPKFDLNGQIIQKRYVMAESTKDAVLQQHSEFDAVMGTMASQLIDKEMTPVINAELVDALQEMYDHPEYGFKAMPEAYVEVSPTSSVQRYRGIYHQLPYKTQLHIESTFGSHKMMVPRDIIDLAFGQRKASITDLFGKTPADRSTFESIMVNGLTFALGLNNPFVDPPEGYTKGGSAKGNAAVRAKSIEDFMMQITKIAKSNIVVRNLNVIFGNHASNTMYLKSKGVSLRKISNLTREATESAVRYQQDKYDLDQLILKRGVTERKTSITVQEKTNILRNIDRKVLELEDMLANNPSTAMIDAGLLPNVVDDVDTDSTQHPYRFGVDAVLENGLSKLPGKAEKATRALFMTEDSSGYKIMNNAVKMTDYIGRYVLYHHYTEQGVSHDDAVARVQDEFINFDLPTHKMLEYLNSVGLIWFSKYQLRVLKHIKNVVKERPFTAIATYMAGMVIGNNNILNSIPGITKDALQGFSNPIASLWSSWQQILNIELVDQAVR
jgi:hypothetical protein